MRFKKKQTDGNYSKYRIEKERKGNPHNRVITVHVLSKEECFIYYCET